MGAGAMLAMAVLITALALHVVATWTAARLAWTSRRLSWTALALAIVLMTLWRSASAYDVATYAVPIDLGSELLAGVIASLTIVGLRTASRAHAELRRSEDRHRAVFESAMDAIVVLDESERIVYANPGVASVFGHAPQALIGESFKRLAPNPEPAFDRATPTGGRCNTRDRIAQLKGLHASGRLLDLEVTFGAHVEDGQVMRTGILRDVTEREELQAQLRRSEERYSLASRGANDGLWDWDLKQNLIFFSQRWKQMLGMRDGEPSSSPATWFGRIHHQDSDRVRARLMAHLSGEADHFECEHRMRHADGRYRWVLCRGLAVRDESGMPYRIAGSQTDITLRKEAEERLLHDALHDSLTGLPNRVLLLERLSRCLGQARRRGGQPFAVLFVDLDRFKNVNDSLGHATGDRLLIEVARKLELCVRPADTVARLGGDEFAILLDDVENCQVATSIADRVLASLSESVQLDGHDIVTTASIGITWGDPGYEKPDDLLRDADAAMYRAKALGKARYQLFDAQMHEQARARLDLETELRRAVEREEIEVHYQPIVSLATGRICGFEALARWTHDGRAVSPQEFIPLAEETGLIAGIDLGVMRKAFKQLAAWQNRFNLSEPLSVSVNLSGRHLLDPSVVERLSEVLAEAQPAPGTVRLEITESFLLADDPATIDLLERLRALGFKLVIDDFGTGYSSLSYLDRLPVDSVKLDRSFVHELETAADRAAIVRTVVALAKQLSLDVVAEGVETSAQLERLRQYGCDLAQGFFFSRPVDADSAAALVAREIDVLDATTRSDPPPARVRGQRPRLVA
jgi:diguanylate cyclase (GGDEF)-like protein/PAS domain S-box-containing protein